MADAYTKCVLTVIAVALCVLAAQGFIAAHAQTNSVQRVQICDENSKCLFLSPIRQRASTGDRFLTFALPTILEKETP